jgi:DNA-3-methyladenine glycosylase I
MNDAGIVRNRAKIEGTVATARNPISRSWKTAPAFEIPVGFRRRQAEGQPFQDHRQRAGIDAAIDQDVEGTGARGFKFVGPTIVYAFMQATGMVNDHLVTCRCRGSDGRA